MIDTNHTPELASKNREIENILPYRCRSDIVRVYRFYGHADLGHTVTVSFARDRTVPNTVRSGFGRGPGGYERGSTSNG